MSDKVKDLQKIVDGYKQLYQFLIEFQRMSLIKRNIVLKQLKEQIRELELKIDSEASIDEKTSDK